MGLPKPSAGPALLFLTCLLFFAATEVQSQRTRGKSRARGNELIHEFGREAKSSDSMQKDDPGPDPAKELEERLRRYQQRRLGPGKTREHVTQRTLPGGGQETVYNISYSSVGPEPGQARTTSYESTRHFGTSGSSSGAGQRTVSGEDDDFKRREEDLRRREAELLNRISGGSTTAGGHDDEELRRREEFLRRREEQLRRTTTQQQHHHRSSEVHGGQTSEQDVTSVTGTRTDNIRRTSTDIGGRDVRTQTTDHESGRRQWSSGGSLSWRELYERYKTSTTEAPPVGHFGQTTIHDGKDLFGSQNVSTSYDGKSVTRINRTSTTVHVTGGSHGSTYNRTVTRFYLYYSCIFEHTVLA